MTTTSEVSFQQLAKSSIIKNGGYQVLENLATPFLIEALRREAQLQFTHAQRNEAKISLPLPERGGQPARRLFSGPGGHVLESFYHDPGVLHQLQQCTGLALTRTGEQGSFSYYLQEGDYLSLHRDLLSCDVTLITTIEDLTKSTKGGMLCLYPERLFEPIANILKTPLRGAKLLRLKPGESLVLLGGIVPHWVLPVGKNETRITALLCYKAF